MIREHYDIDIFGFYINLQLITTSVKFKTIAKYAVQLD